LIGDWGLGIGDWGLGIGPNPQSPIPNPHLHYNIQYIFDKKIKYYLIILIK
jgi:cytochrome oxidase assembly protein ShyY1